MRTALILALACLAIAPGLAAGNPIPWGGPISAYADPTGTDICLYDLDEGILTVYIVHNLYFEYPLTGATGSRFAAPKPPCLAATYAGETSPFATMGDSQTGIQIMYGGCVTGEPFLILIIVYVVHGATPAECAYEVVPDPGEPSGSVILVDCSPAVRETWGGVAYINGYEPLCDPIATDETTWGRIKSLYR